jgi:tartrate dehydratase alpha subunit/fumarate hydratase class I-like protein
MKKYIVITASDFSYDIIAKNISDAKKIGRTLCRRTGEIFVSVKYVK